MAVEEATGDEGCTIKMCDIVGREEASEEVANYASQAVDAENVETRDDQNPGDKTRDILPVGPCLPVINVHVIFQLRPIICRGCTQSTKHDRRPGGYIAGAGRDTDESGDRA